MHNHTNNREITVVTVKACRKGR